MKYHEKPCKAMKNQPGTMKNHEKPTWNHENHENPPGTMKYREKKPETMKNQPGTVKNHEKP